MQIKNKQTIKSRYPCCKGACRFTFYAAVPRERYERRCPSCGQRWEIKRSLMMILYSDGSRMDRLDWEKQGC